jgi:hypothetical protein
VLGLPPRHMHMRLGLVACSVVVACVLLPGCAAFPPPTREGASSPAPPGTEALESPAAAAPRVAASGAGASAAVEEQDQLQKALEEWHAAYRNLKVALRQICTGEESCVVQNSGWPPAQHSASGVSPPSRFTAVRRSSDATEGAEGSWGDEAPQRGASGETHAEGTSPVTMSWREMSFSGIVLQGFTFALSPLVPKCPLPPSSVSHQRARHTSCLPRHTMRRCGPSPGTCCLQRRRACGLAIGCPITCAKGLLTSKVRTRAHASPPCVSLPVANLEKAATMPTTFGATRNSDLNQHTNSFCCPLILLTNAAVPTAVGL